MTSVYAATEAELERLGVLDLLPGLCANALNVAGRLDETTSARDAAPLSAAHLACMNRLRELAPPVEELGDGVDDLDARRAARRAAAAS